MADGPTRNMAGPAALLLAGAAFGYAGLTLMAWSEPPRGRSEIATITELQPAEAPGDDNIAIVDLDGEPEDAIAHPRVFRGLDIGQEVELRIRRGTARVVPDDRSVLGYGLFALGVLSAIGGLGLMGRRRAAVPAE